MTATEVSKEFEELAAAYKQFMDSLRDEYVQELKKYIAREMADNAALTSRPRLTRE